MTLIKGQRSERFRYLPPVTGTIGPGSYNIDEATCILKVLSQKPTSAFGVAVTTACRFPDLKVQGPGAGQYERETFVDLLKTRAISLGSKPRKPKQPAVDSPGPGTYDPNYAIGRHVGNDDRFALTRSTWLTERKSVNKFQMDDIHELLESNKSFSEKRLYRRMAHLALYY